MSDFWRRGAAAFLQLKEDDITRSMRERFKLAVMSILPAIISQQDQPVRDAFEQQQLRVDAEQREQRRRERLAQRIRVVDE